MLKCTTCVVFSFFVSFVSSFPDPGQWSKTRNKEDSPVFGFAKPLYAGSSIFISINCEPYSPDQKIDIQWVLRQIPCFEDSLSAEIYNHPNLTDYFICPISTTYSPQVRYFISKTVRVDCSNRIHLQQWIKFTIPIPDEECVDFSCDREKSAHSSSGNFTDVVFKTYSDNSDIPEVCANIPATKYVKIGNNSKISQTDLISQSNETLRPKRNAILNDTLNMVKPSSKDNSKQSHSKPAETVGDSAKEATSDNANDVINAASKKNNDTAHKQYDYISAPLSSPNQVKPGTKLATVDMDGIYLFILRVRSVDQSKFNITVDVAMKGDSGYLSAVDYPLLLFYGIMCGLYVIYAVVWLVMSALQWRDLLRIQFWIGAVILLGLMEKAVFYAEYQSINFTGQSVEGAILFAEILSCMKRTLARMLIIIVSLGFGIVKPRLGPMLHRIIGVGALYFCLGTIEGCLRVLKHKTDPGNQALMAGIPLAVTDSAICWWIFSSLVETIRTLRLRRNIVKLQLYKHFTNALLFSVIGSVAFMTWSIHAHKLVNCITDWKELWVDEAYWHFLFSVILFVIMILWRPTNNNQRYAFTPLLDAMDEDDEDDEENHLTNDAFVGMKMRTTKSNSSASPKHDESKSKQDEDLKWVEENIPTSLTDVALPSLLDSDEEIMTAKFERSKME